MQGDSSRSPAGDGTREEKGRDTEQRHARSHLVHRRRQRFGQILTQVVCTLPTTMTIEHACQSNTQDQSSRRSGLE